MNDDELAAELARRLLEGPGGQAVWDDMDDLGDNAARSAVAEVLVAQGLSPDQAADRARIRVWDEREAHRAFLRMQQIGIENTVDPLTAPPRPDVVRRAMEENHDPRHRTALRALLDAGNSFWRRGRRQ